MQLMNLLLALFSLVGAPMPLVANTQYFAKLITVDKQGNQTIGPQTTITTDAVHNADVHPDLQQNFRVQIGSNLTLPAGASGNQLLKLTSITWISGSGGYNTVTGLYTVGQTGKLVFAGQAEMQGQTLPVAGTMRVALTKNGVTLWFGPNASAIADAGTGSSTVGTICALIVGSVSVAAGDTVGLQIYWQGLGGRVLSGPNANTFFQGFITPG
jgi:hypothetical protein